LLVGLVAFTWRVLGRRPPFALEGEPFSLTLPTCGIDPLATTASLLALSVSVFTLRGVKGPAALEPGHTVYSLLFLVVAGNLAVALSLLYNRPSRVARLWFGPEATEAQLGVVRSHLARATVRSAGFVLGVAGLVLVVPSYFSIPLVAEASVMAIVAAVLLDAREEWRFRARHPDLAPAWTVNRLYAVQPALEALGAAGIEAFPRGLRHRSLLQFFGPYVPVTLLVPAQRVEEAQLIVRERLLGSSDSEVKEGGQAGAQAA
jgi:hypothetical protein